MNKTNFVRREKRIDWMERGVDAWVKDILQMCKNLKMQGTGSYKELTNIFSQPAKLYFALAARSRAKDCVSLEKIEIDSKLFLLRTEIEKAIYGSLMHNLEPFEGLIFERGFFGGSGKQGATVRFPLFSCVPTEKCSSGCYAHDGRDKHLTSIIRGVFNFILCEWIKKNIESDSNHGRFSKFLHQIDVLILDSIAEAESSKISGYERQARIRLSHVGEMASMPEVTNWIASLIINRSKSRVIPVIYTRHPDAIRLDSKRIVVNFTIESDSDPRRIYAPKGARLVGSSWAGQLIKIAEVNFLEHHGTTHSVTQGAGTVCPVTAYHEATPSCDSAHCNKCFCKPILK